MLIRLGSAVVWALVGAAEAKYIAPRWLAELDGAPESAPFTIASALLWGIVGLVYPLWQYPFTALIYGVMTLLLIRIAVTDFITFTIPNRCSACLALLGIARLAADHTHFSEQFIGALIISLPFWALHALTRGRGLGFGDVKLMAAAGFLLGAPRVLLATVLGSVLGSVIHIWRMRGGAEARLAFGPYLSLGIYLSALFGDRLIAAYLSLFGL